MEELTVDAIGPKDADLDYLQSAVAIRNESLLVVRAASLQLPEGAGDAGGTGGVALQPAKR